MKCLVTGASGFIGGHLVQKLVEKNHEVHALLRSTSRTGGLPASVIRHEGDITKPESVRLAVTGMDAVFHLAAVLRARSPAEYLAVNAEGTRAVAEAMRDESKASGRPVRLIYLSSLAAGGPAHPDRPVSANDEPHPISDYGRTKLAGERVVRETLGGIPWVALRPPPVYGPGDRDVLKLFQVLKSGVMPLPGGGRQKIPMIHVGDVADAAVLAAESAVSGRIYYVTDGRIMTLRETLDEMARAIGKKPFRLSVPLFAIGIAGEIGQLISDVTGKPMVMNRDKATEALAPDWSCDDRPARVELGFAPQFPLARGLRDTVDWYRREGWL